MFIFPPPPPPLPPPLPPPPPPLPLPLPPPPPSPSPPPTTNRIVNFSHLIVKCIENFPLNSPISTNIIET